jgi:hypothetical protein
MQIRRILATPSLIKVKELSFEQTNPVIRQYKELVNYFCRVTLVTEKDREAFFLSSSLQEKNGKTENEFSKSFLVKILKDGINLFGSKLIRLNHSNSSMKKKSFWFVSEDGDVIKRDAIIKKLGIINEN